MPDDSETNLQSVSVRPEIQFTAGRMTPERRPFVTFTGDRAGWEFQRHGVLQVPCMLALLSESNALYRDLMVDVRSDFFRDRTDITWEVTISIGEEQLLRVPCWRIYAHHQCIIPLGSFYQETTEVRITAAPIDAEQPAASPGPVFTARVILCDKRELWKAQEKRSIWLFSTARSGSTWLGSDIICWRHRARPVDESGIGRLFAPISWEPERFFGLEKRADPYESGFSFETGEMQRYGKGAPPFERIFRDMRRELQVLNRINFDLYHKLLRDCVLEHVLNEWGVLHYKRLVFKMPNDSHAADFIMRAFPQSHMIFMMRDGRDVMRSRFSPFASPTLAAADDPDLRLYAIAFYAHFWNFQVDIIRSAYEAHDPARRYFIRYEDLRSDPVRQIGELLGHLEMALSPEELDQLARDVTLENVASEQRGPDKPRQDGLVGGFRAKFSTIEVDLMNRIMGGNLTRYGYSLT